MDSPAARPDASRGGLLLLQPEAAPASRCRRDIDQIRGVFFLAGLPRLPCHRLRGALARRRRIPGHLTRTAIR